MKEKIEKQDLKSEDVKKQKDTIETQKKEEQKIDENAIKIEDEISNCRKSELEEDIQRVSTDFYNSIIERVSDGKN